MRVTTSETRYELRRLSGTFCFLLLTFVATGVASGQPAGSDETGAHGFFRALSEATSDARTSADEFLENALAADIKQEDTGSQLAAWMAAVKPTTRKSIAIGVLAGSLSLLALFLLRQSPARRRGVLPDDVVSLLGQVPFGPNQKLQLVRLGSKLLLVTTTPAGSHTLGEISDPEEVLQIETLCRSGRYDAIGATLRSRIRSDSREPGQRESSRNRAVFEA